MPRPGGRAPAAARERALLGPSVFPRRSCDTSLGGRRFQVVPSQVTVWIEAPCAGPGVAGAEPYGDVPVTVGGCVRPVLQGLLRDRK